MDRFALRDWWRSHATWRTAYLLFLGQVVSFVMALMSFTSSLIADLGKLFRNPISDFFIPFLSFSFWPLLVLILFVWLCTCVGVDTPLTQTLFGYFVLALVYGNLLLYRRQRLKVSSKQLCLFVFCINCVMGLKL